MHTSIIKWQRDEPPNLKLLIGAVAAILSVISGIATVMAWVPGANAVSSIEPVLDSPAEQMQDTRRVRTKCPECGIVKSMRLLLKPGAEIDHGLSGVETRGGRNTASRTPIRIAEVTIRMSNGASHQFIDANPANWRLGERVMVIRDPAATDD